jgi:hypothetical protein
MWEERAERIIVSASSDSLAMLDETQWVLSKIGMLISHLEREGKIRKFEIDMWGQKEKQKMLKYLRLLEGLEIVKKVEDDYTYGNMFPELRHNCHDFYEFKIATFSYILKHRYPVLKELFGISQLETYVHLDSSYYRPALEVEEVLYSTGDSILKHYRNIYGNKSDLRLTYALGELVHSKALCLEDNYYFANEQMFKCMLELKNKSHSLVPIRA